MTLEERGALEKFKDLLEEKDIDYDSDENDDLVLLRFLRARKLDLNKALEMFNEYLKFREEYQVDEIEVNRIIIQKFNFHERDEVLKYFKYGYHKTDKMV